MAIYSQCGTSTKQAIDWELLFVFVSEGWILLLHLQNNCFFFSFAQNTELCSQKSDKKP